MTLIFMISILVLALLLLTARMAPRVSLARKSEEELRSCLMLIDVAAFENLIHPDEDAFLKASLPARHYRTAKRVRTRAVQQYLRWIARDCLVLQLIAAPALQSQDDRAPHQEESWRARCSRMRTSSLLLWSALWLQWLFPTLNLMPDSLLGRYGGFVARMRIYLNSPRPSSTSSAAQT